MDHIKLSDHFTYKRIFRFTMPSVAMMLFVSVYGIVDGFFVSNFVGATPFAALNLIMPFIMVLSAVGFMLGTGGAAIVGKTLGEGDTQLAKRYFSFIVWVALIVGAALGIFGAVFMRQAAIFLGADGDMVELCVVYGRINMISMPAFMLQYIFQSFFITAEKPKLGFIMTVIAGVTNIILDIVLVGVLGLGLAAAAWATITGEIIGAVVSVIYFARENDSTLRIVPTQFYPKVLAKTCTNGCSELVSNISLSFISMVFNFQLMKYAGETGVIAYGVIMYVSWIIWAIFSGYAVGIAPVISFNFGAQTHQELKNIFSKCMKIMSVGSLVALAFSMLTARVVCMIFVGYDQELLDFTVRAYYIYAIGYLFIGVNCFGSTLFTALNNGVISAVISIVRTFAFKLTLVLILPTVLLIDGVWWSTCLAEVFAFVVTAVFIIVFRKKYKYA